MPKSLCAPLTFYPAYCFALSPTHNTWSRLTAPDVHALQERSGFEGQNLYFHLNHPIKWIRLVGAIVALDIFVNRWIMILDDSSGATVEITCGRPKSKEPTMPKDDLNGLAKASAIPDTPTEGTTATGRSIDLTGIDVGTVVKVKGGIGSFRGEKQVLLERISIVHTTNEEAASWAENNNFRQDILNHPWVVSEHDGKRAKRKAEGLDRELKARVERRRKKLHAIPDPKSAAAEKERERREEAKRKQDEERRRREEAKKKLEDEKRHATAADAKNKQKREEEVKRLTTEEEKARNEEATRTNTEREKKERDRGRREQERKIREMEYQRLMEKKGAQ